MLDHNGAEERYLEMGTLKSEDQKPGSEEHTPDTDDQVLASKDHEPCSEDHEPDTDDQ